MRQKRSEKMKHFNWLPVGLIALLLASTLLGSCVFVKSGTGVYSTLGDFPDSETLASWVESHAQEFEPGGGAEAWYRAAIAVQREAANDGYLVSAVITGNPDFPGEYMVWCTALAGGDLYWWHPEDTECTLMFTSEELGL